MKDNVLQYAFFCCLLSAPDSLRGEKLKKCLFENISYEEIPLEWIRGALAY